MENFGGAKKLLLKPECRHIGLGSRIFWYQKLSPNWFFLLHYIILSSECQQPFITTQNYYRRLSANIVDNRKAEDGNQHW